MFYFPTIARDTYNISSPHIQYPPAFVSAPTLVAICDSTTI